MSCMGIGSYAEENAKLLIRLMKEHGALDLGAISNFFEVSSEWCCPSCHRTKAEQVRLDKNGNLMAAIHRHHDHMINLADDCIPSLGRDDITWQERRPYDSLRSNFQRFPDTLICNDCNVIEGLAKGLCKAHSCFSFSPFEISTFIIVESNRPHRLDTEKVLRAWEHVSPSLKTYGNELRQINKFKRDPDGFESIGGAACRVLKDVMDKMKKNEGSDS